MPTESGGKLCAFPNIRVRRAIADAVKQAEELGVDSISAEKIAESVINSLDKDATRCVICPKCKDLVKEKEGGYFCKVDGQIFFSIAFSVPSLVLVAFEPVRN